MIAGIQRAVLAGLGVLVATAMAGPEAARWMVGFSAHEIHTAFPYAPPGFRDVPDHRQVFDGDRSAFDLLEAQVPGSRGGIAVESGRPGEGGPVIVQSEAAFRALSMVMARAWQSDGPRGVVPAAEVRDALASWPGWAEAISGACPRAGCPIPALVESSRFLRLTAESLARMDADGDGVVTREEFRGAPLARPHFLGSDALGRDALVRLLDGLRLSVAVGVTSALAAASVGVAYGAVAGMAGGLTGMALMRIVDVLYGLPFLFVVILLISLLGPSLGNLFLAIVCVQWLGMARTVHHLVASLRQAPFVMAASTMGCRPVRLCATHILPNARGPILAWTALLVPASIKEEAFLSFLGLGVQAPRASLGTLIAEGAPRIADAPWLVAWPAAILFLLVLLVHLACDGWENGGAPSRERRREPGG